MLFSEQCTFLRDWLSDPLRVAAVAPSSHSLAEIITGEITTAHAPVIELGPGTGVFTRRLIQRGIPQERLALVESGYEFAKRLDRRFPTAQVLCMDACRLDQIELFDGELAGAVVSSLPLLWMPTRKVIGILRASFAHLRPGGSFYQFTYTLRCPVARCVLERCGLRATRIGGTLINVPPASVYRISRRNMLIGHADHEPLQSHKRNTLLVCP
jgi:phosphatidylethanolamine/phosphatidyl-N-methylethanolamine N-methyltransferase